MKNNSPGTLDMKKSRSLRETRKARREETKAYSEILRAGIAKRKVSRKDRRLLEALIGDRPYSGPLLGSDIAARAELQRQLIQLVNAHQRQNPKMRYFFLTMFSDEYRVDKRKPVLFLRKLRAKSDKAIRMLVKDFQLVGALGMIEATFIANPPDTQLPEFPFHTHALCWAGPDFDLAGAQAAIEGLQNWTHGWGIPPIKFKEITSKQGVAAWWARYLAKHPLNGMNIVELDDGGVRPRTVKKLRMNVRLRLLEGLSQCAIADLIFGVADGKYIRDPAVRRMKAARKLAHTMLTKVSVVRIAAAWRRVWAASTAHHSKGWLVIS